MIKRVALSLQTSESPEAHSLKDRLLLLTSEKLLGLIEQAKKLHKEIAENQGTNLDSVGSKYLNVFNLNTLLREIESEQNRLEQRIREIAKEVIVESTDELASSAMGLKPFLKDLYNASESLRQKETIEAYMASMKKWIPDEAGFAEFREIHEQTQWELAKKAAEKNGLETSKNIARYGIKDPSKLFDIAKTAATQSGAGTLLFIKNYGIQDDDMLFEIAKIAVMKEGYRALRQVIYHDIGSQTLQSQILDKNRLLEIVKMATAHSGEKCLLLAMDYFGHAKTQEDKIFELLDIVERKKALSKGSLDWFKSSLAKLDNPAQRRINIVFITKLLASPAALQIFTDQASIRIMQTIAETPHARIKDKSADALILLFQSGNEALKEEWKQRMMSNLEEHLLLTHLALTAGRFPSVKVSEWLLGLSSAHYAASNVITPFNEMILLLNSATSIEPEKKEVLLHLALDSPKKQQGEKEKEFQKRMKAHRDKQEEIVTAIRDLLFLGENTYLNESHEPDALTTHWAETVRKNFGIVGDREVMLKFGKTFNQSLRYPGALMTYAARLHTLQDQELIDLLGIYATAVLDESYPNIRYDLKRNAHLATVFHEKTELLSKWKAPLSFRAVDILERSERSKTQAEDPREFIKKSIKHSLSNHHLSQDLAQEYPKLNALKDSRDPAAFAAVIIEMDEKIKDIAAQMKSKTELEDLQKERRRLTREKLCLQLIDPNINANKVDEYLNVLSKQLEESQQQFKQDIVGMRQQLKPQETNYNRLVVYDSDNWEDVLLVGTEEKNSCQSIEGEPEYNKCKLAYMLDGKNKLEVVKEINDDKIQARAVIRMLGDAKTMKPVMFFERTYTTKNDSIYYDLLREGAIRKAKELGVVLVASDIDYPDVKNLKPYPNPLKSLGSRAPYEYVDALSGIQRDGIFTIEKSFVLYEPTPKQ